MQVEPSTVEATALHRRLEMNREPREPQRTMAMQSGNPRNEVSVSVSVRRRRRCLPSKTVSSR